MKDLWIVFDGRPGFEAGKFVEIEDGSKASVFPPGVDWYPREDGYWKLGPFRAEGVPSSCLHRSRQTLAVAGMKRSSTTFFCNNCGERFEAVQDGPNVAWKSLDTGEEDDAG